jgi:hypothetical protein
MDKVFEDLDFAVKNMRLSDGKNVIHRYVPMRFSQGFCLYEGTYRK